MAGIGQLRKALDAFSQGVAQRNPLPDIKPKRPLAQGGGVGNLQAARKRLEAAYQAANPRGKALLKPLIDNPEAMMRLPDGVLQRLASGDPSGLLDATRYTTLDSRTAGQWSAKDGGSSKEAWTLGLGGAGAVAAGAIAGGKAASDATYQMASDALQSTIDEMGGGEQYSPQVMQAAIEKLMANGMTYEQASESLARATAPRPESKTADLSDGLDGAPQDDITPEPMAGSPSRSALINKPRAPSADTQDEDERYQDYVNSLPFNSPEAKAARQRRYNEEDASLAEAEAKLEPARERLADLQKGGIPASFDPGALGEDERLPGASSARPQSYANPSTFDPMAAADPRQAFRDFERSEDMRRRSSGVPVEAQRERDFASGQYGDFDERLAGQSRFAQAAQFDPNGEFGPNDFQRRYNPQATAEWNRRMQEKIRRQARSDRAKYEEMQERDRDTPLASSQFSDTATNLFEAKAERAALETRVKNYARQNGLSYDDALAALQAQDGSPFLALQKTLPGDRYTTLERQSGQRKRLAAQVDRRDEQALRRERLATAGLLGISQPQANAFLMLSPEDRNRAVNYITNPMAARIDLAEAQREGAQFDPLKQNAMAMQQNAAYSSGYANAKGRDPNGDVLLWEDKPSNAREWEDLRDEIIGNEAPGSPGYEGAMRYFNQKYGPTPPEATEETGKVGYKGPEPTQENGIQPYR